MDVAFETGCSPRSLESDTDQLLLERYRAGDEGAAKELYERYVQRIGSVARKKIGDDLKGRLDADDVVQSVFRSFFSKARQGFYDIPENGELWPLLVVMAVQKVRSRCVFHRAQRRDPQRESFGPGAEPADAKSNETLAQMVLDEAVESLPAAHRQIVRWRLEGRDHQEIAVLLRRSRRTVERLFQECRHFIHRFLREAD